MDVIHVADEDLDRLVGAPEDRPVRRLLLAIILCSILRARKIALVRTVHIVEQKKPTGTAARLARRLLDDATSIFVSLEGASPTPDGVCTADIRHSHYRDRFIGYPHEDMVRGRILYLVPSNPESEINSLVAAALAASVSGITLRIAGRVGEEVEASVRADCARHATTLSARLEQLSDGARVQEITAAEVVVIPRVDSIEAVQTALLALSLNRLVLMPRTAWTTKLARDVTTGWTHLSDGPITSATLVDAVAKASDGNRGPRPDLTGRDLPTIRSHYLSAFQAASQSHRGNRGFIRPPGPR
ncbi:hypothetical protein ACQ143_10165 [Microbacterium sp. MC2]